MEVNRRVWADLPDAEKNELLQRAQRHIDEVVPAAKAIVERVRDGGDKALVAATREFDGVELSPGHLAVPDDEFEAAEGEVSDDFRELIGRAISNIRRHHEAQLGESQWMHETMPGVLCGERTTPIASVGLYVPRGKGSFPSVMMMLCVPAVVAGVERIIVCTPPTAEGLVDPVSLVVARMCGVNEVYRVGGAQAIGAMAYGTETIPKVEKIIGPGNPWVSAAKRVVSGVVDPGLPAGPSEAVILCDAAADPEIAARELLVEAEHGPDSAALLVTDSPELADLVEARLPALIARLPEERRSYCEKVLSHLGGIIITDDLDASIELSNRYAPEHLRLLVADPFGVLQKIDHAGEVLLGPRSSIAFGNFAVGVNAILPTGGTARSRSATGVHEFLKRSSWAYVSEEGAANIGDIAVTLARYEGFAAHADAASYVMGPGRST
jgi:histidinol dehydrogenase